MPVDATGEVRWSDNFNGRQPAAVASAFAVLEQVARAGPGITAREIAENLKMPRATAYRLIKQLTESEYLVRTLDLRGFALGSRLVELVRLGSDSADPEQPLQE